MPKASVGFTKPPEPAFITKMKQDIGMTEESTVETKRAQLSAATDEDLEDRDDDLPTVVVLKKGDLSAEEAKVEIEKQQKDIDDTPAGEGGRIMFKKPVKREIDAASSKKEPEGGKKSKRDSDTKSGSSKKGDAKLLSFNDDDEEDDF